MAEGRILPTFKEAGQMLLTFFLVVIGWIIFRAPGMPTVLHYLQGMCQLGTLRASYRFFTSPEMWPTNLFIVVMLGVEWLQRDNEHGLSINGKLKQPLVRWCVYLLITLMVFVLQSNKAVQFIYFQF